MRIVTGLRIGLAVIMRALKARRGKTLCGRGGASAPAIPSTEHPCHPASRMLKNLVFS